MANPMLIQKQIKDNSEDLHSFVRDLKLWEEEMKRKDRQLSNGPSEEILPPIRRAKISDKLQAKKKDNYEMNQNKRIASYDYKSWDKFDVDKACEEVDNDGNESEEGTDEENAQQEEQFLKEKALYEKELGNRYVKVSKWDEAIEAYTKAILAFPKDPVFFANRALCYLKKNRYDAAELDCTDSLKLDPTYVKAYLRRAAAHEAMSQDEAAAFDLRRALQLEPHNQQAQHLLTSLTDKEKKKKETDKGSLLKQDIPLINQNTRKSVPSSKCESSTSQPVESSKNYSATETNVKKIGISNNYEEPLWKPCGKIVEPISKPPHLRSKEKKKKETDKGSLLKQDIPLINQNTRKSVPSSKCESSTSQPVESSKNYSATETNVKKIGISNNYEEPLWKPCGKIVEPISKPPHLRSKKILKRIEIHDIGFNWPKHVCSRLTPESQDPSSPIEPSTKIASPSELSSGVRHRSVVTLNLPVIDTPPPPNTSVQFYKSWSSIKSDKLLCFQFLKQIPGESLPEIFKESLESRMFSNIVETLASQFIAAAEPVLPYLRGLSAVRRFSTITLFMTSDDKSNLLKLFEYCENTGECSKQDVFQLQRLYEMI